MPNTIPVITIDGPSSVGKGTISKLLAKKLGWHFLDSGALYRVLGLACQKHQIPITNEEAVAKLAKNLAVRFQISAANIKQKIILEDEDVTKIIRTEKIGNIASKIAIFPKVRQALSERQRAFRKPPGLIADGRDMGTVIFPDASVKIFLEGSPEVRAQRRYQELLNNGISVRLADINAEVAKRDERDKNRKIAPLKPAASATIIDTTLLTIEQVFTRVENIVQKNLKLE